MEEQYFSEEHLLLRDMVRNFARNELAPIAREIDESGKFPLESIQKMGELGLMGIPWSEQYGGFGMDTLALVIAIEELGKVCTSTAATMMAHTSLGSAPIYLFGTEEQKQKYIPKLASGERLGAFGLTEPNAGSDAGATETTAIKMVLAEEHAGRVALSSTKSMTGHLAAGAGGIEAVAAVLTMQHGCIPPTINYVTPDSECDLDVVPNEARVADIRVVMSNSFGLGGQNASAVFRRHEE